MTATPAAPTYPALAQLKDINLPEQIGSWPPAPGYFLLAALTVALVVALAWFYLKRQKRLTASRQAVELVALLDKGSADYPRQINTLLKRTALTYLPRNQVASLDGEKWIALLSTCIEESEQQALQHLLAARFSPGGLNMADASELEAIAIKVLKSLPDAKLLAGTNGEAQPC